jgi:hypothetical protein
MKGEVGDRIAILSRHLGEQVRECEIVGVHDTAGGPPYVVRWRDTGHLGVFFPGPDARVVHDAQAAPAAITPDIVRAEQWQVTVGVVEDADGKTEAHVAAHTGRRSLQADGSAQRLPGDIENPPVGAEVAAGRAFVTLGEKLLVQAMQDIEDAGPQDDG